MGEVICPVCGWNIDIVERVGLLWWWRIVGSPIGGIQQVGL